MPNAATGAPPVEPASKGQLHRVAVWDTPTRTFHWLLVLLVAVSFVTGKLGGTAMVYHERSGACILGLVLFRIVWGFVGGRQARFAAFVRGPAKVVDYVRTFLRPEAKPYLGHNPLGGWSILAMLAALSLQAVTGLFATDDILTEGPLVHWVSGATSQWLTRVHHMNATLLTALVGLHVGAIAFYRVVKGENLVKPMIVGYKLWPEPVGTKPSSALLAAGLAVVLAVGIYLVLY